MSILGLRLIYIQTLYMEVMQQRLCLARAHVKTGSFKYQNPMSQAGQVLISQIV